jgi:hypothetical protein
MVVTPGIDYRSRRENLPEKFISYVKLLSIFEGPTIRGPTLLYCSTDPNFFLFWIPIASNVGDRMGDASSYY